MLPDQLKEQKHQNHAEIEHRGSKLDFGIAV